MAFTVLGGLAIGLMFSVVVLIVPGINAVASPKFFMTEVQSFLKTPTDPIRTFQHWNWRNDEDLYYWQHVHKSADMVGGGLDDQGALHVLQQRLDTSGTMVVLMTERQYDEIVSPAPGLRSTIVREFLRPKHTILLVSLETKS